MKHGAWERVERELDQRRRVSGNAGLQRELARDPDLMRAAARLERRLELLCALPGAEALDAQPGGPSRGRPLALAAVVMLAASVAVGVWFRAPHRTTAGTAAETVGPREQRIAIRVEVISPPAPRLAEATPPNPSVIGWTLNPKP